MNPQAELPAPGPEQPTLGSDTAAPASRHPLTLPHMRSLWLGSTISLLGDQFYLVALPWLVLQLTGSGLALGTILLTTAVPRAVLMLAGGAVTDRVSARRVLIASSLVRTLVVGLVATLIWFRLVQLWHLYLLTFTFGVADAFSLPAGQALIPTLVDKQQLGAANSLLQGSTMLAQIAGPVPAGLIIRSWGIAAALFFDALSFLAVIAALFKIPEPPRRAAPPEAGGAVVRQGMGHAIAEGLQAVRKDSQLLALMMLGAIVNIAIYGPIIVGIAAAAKFRFGSAAAFGTCLSAQSGGILVGILLGGRVKRPRRRGLQFIAMSALAGLELIGIGLTLKLAATALLLALMGLGIGFVNVQFTSWVQARVEQALMGRVMSLLILSAVGLIPVSYAITGALVQWNLAAAFLIPGAALVVASTAALANRTARAID